MAFEALKPFFDLSPDVRYVAVYRKGALQSSARPGVPNPSSSQSDRFEELVVNPALLTLLVQRGNIDCGGLEHVLIRYGNFYEFVRPIEGGHVSVGIDPHIDPLALVPALAELARTL